MNLPVSPSFRLDGRRAVVTGAGRGLGRAFAAALADAGAEVTMLARTVDEIEEGASLIRRQGGKAHFHSLDVTNCAAVSDFFAHHPPFHILVNNAGSNRPKPFVEINQEDFEAVIGLNLRSSFFVAQAVVARMIDTDTSGSLVHIGSQMGHVGAAQRTLYCASKWALEGLSKALAIELAPHAIRSNVIAPTYVETPLTKPFLADEKFRSHVMRQIPLGRLGRSEDLMGAAVFLASDASALITGTSLLVDGGWTAQ